MVFFFFDGCFKTEGAIKARAKEIQIFKDC